MVHILLNLNALFGKICCLLQCSLSVTKWVHLNWGDDGLITLFSKIWRLLRPVIFIYSYYAHFIFFKLLMGSWLRIVVVLWHCPLFYEMVS